MEDHLHLDTALLRAVARGERDPGDLATVALTHLLELCPACRRAFEGWRRELGEGVADGSLCAYDDAVEACGRAVEEQQCVVESAQAEARERAAELLVLPAGDRAERVRRNPSRYGGAALGDLLLDEARGHLPGRPREAWAMAALAQTVLQHGRDTPYAAELYARALGHQANALRAQGELLHAERLFQAARYLLKPQAGGDPLTRAELDAFEGSLRGAQGRLDEAEGLLRRALVTYRSEERTQETVEVLIRLGMVYRKRGEMERAVEVVRQAEGMLGTERDGKRLLSVRHNLAFYLYEAGEPAQARTVFDSSRPLYERFPDPPTQLRRLWLEGHLARAEGQPDEAETAYREVREGFLRQGVGYDAALVSLDLATLYAERGRTRELKRLAEEIAPVFEAQDVHREAAAALLLFQDAVRAEQVTLRSLVELSRYLERARLDPSLPYRRPA